MKLSSRMALAMVVLVALTALAVGWLSYHNVRSAVLPSAAERAEVRVRVLATTLAGSVGGAREDIIGFQKAVALQGIVRARAAGGVDPQDNMTEAAWSARLADRFVAELMAKKSYDKFRIIQADGREIVRVDRSGPNGAVRVVPDEELQQTSERPFFVPALATPLDQVYVSPIDLVQDNGAIHVPHVPVLRVAMRVDLPDGKPFGIVIINVDMRPIFRELAASTQPGYQVYVVDDRGNYLLNPDHSREFSIDLGKPQRWQNDYPVIAPLFTEDEAKSLFLTDDKNAELLVSLASVRLADGPRVGVLEVAPFSAVVAPALAVGRSTLLVGLTAVLCATVLAILLARSLTRPLVQMTRAVEAFGRDQSDCPARGRRRTIARAPQRAAGEIGVLATAFTRMMAEVKEKTASLEKAIAEHRRAEAEIERHSDRERLLSAAVQSSNDFIVTLTLDGVVTSWNPAAERLFGWTAEEMFGRSIDRIVPKDRFMKCGLSSIPSPVAKSSKTSKRSGSTEVVDKITLSLSVAPIKLASGAVVGACSLARDITAENEAKERLEREIAERRRIAEVLDNTINSMADAVLVGDRDANIVLCNPTAQRMMNISRRYDTRAMDPRPRNFHGGRRDADAAGATAVDARGARRVVRELRAHRALPTPAETPSPTSRPAAPFAWARKIPPAASWSITM